MAQSATDLTCTQCVGSGDIANNAVGSGKIADGSIKSNDMAASAVKTPNLNNGSVTFNKLATGVRGAVDGALENVTLLYVYATDEGIVGAECPVDTISPVPPDTASADAAASATEWRKRQYEAYEAAFEKARKESAIRQSRMRR